MQEADKCTRLPEVSSSCPRGPKFLVQSRSPWVDIRFVGSRHGNGPLFRRKSTARNRKQPPENLTRTALRVCLQMPEQAQQRRPDERDNGEAFKAGASKSKGKWHFFSLQVPLRPCMNATVTRR
jgi:hypothetical protein